LIVIIKRKIFHYSIFVTQKPKDKDDRGRSDSKKTPSSPKFKTGRFDIRDELKNMETSGLTPLNEEQVHEGRPFFPKELSFLTANLDQKMRAVSRSGSEIPKSPSRRKSMNKNYSSQYDPRISDVLVFTCGPEGLCNSAQDFAYQIGASFHSETFFL